MDATCASHDRGPRGDEATLYRRYGTRLLKSVAGAVAAPPAVVGDACATAWLRLIASQPERRATIFAWLRTTAIREVFALTRRSRRERSLEEVASPDGELAWEGLLPGGGDPLASLEARGALEALANLRPRERRYLALKVAGYSYREICELTGATYTNVNKHLARARARLREFRQ